MKNKKEVNKYFELGKDFINKSNPQDLLNSISGLVNNYNDYRRENEIQKTERAKIEADRIKSLKQIETTKEIFLEYLNKSFDERKINFANYFQRLDIAIDNGDIQLMSLLLKSINELASATPFKEIVDTIQLKNALDKNMELDI